MRGSKRAFIFSIDAFIAFMLSLLAIYSLIFFSSIPSAHYALLTQAHYLAKDTLLALSLARCPDTEVCGTGGQVSILDYLVFMTGEGPQQMSEINRHLNKLIPEQFGYRLEASSGGTWEVLYDTALFPSDTHQKTARRISVSSYAVAFSFDSKLPGDADNQYRYNTCHGGTVPCSQPIIATYNSNPQPHIKVVKVTIYA